jgi:membrane-bound lytic murein transglycosylase B
MAATLGSHNIPASLATLAYDGRRSAFFRSQLLDALRIIDAGHVSAADMKGSWAGAMGHMQFMPSTFRAYAVDGDGDARIDLWQSLPDAMHSAANYLQRAGWRAGEPVAIEVRAPQDFDWRPREHRQPRAGGAMDGARRAGGGRQPAAGRRRRRGDRAAAGLAGPGLHGVRQLRRGDALESLGELRAGGGAAGATAGGRQRLAAQAGEAGALSTAQVQALQQALNELGFDAGTPDGLLGPRTQTAIRHYQVMHRLPADGYPAPSMLAHVEQTHAAAAAARQAGARAHLCGPRRPALIRGSAM